MPTPATKLQTGYYYINDLVKEWSTTPNAIFNMAYRNELALHAKKISWPYKIWALTHYENLSLVESGFFSICEVQISYSSGIEKGIYSDSQKIKLLLENQFIEGFKLETFDDDFLTFDIGDFDLKKIGDSIKTYTQCHGEQKPTLYEEISIEKLSDIELHAKHLIAEEFNLVYIDYPPEFESDDYYYPIENPALQVEIDHFTTIEPSDIYVLPKDKGQAEKRFNPLLIKVEIPNNKEQIIAQPPRIRERKPINRNNSWREVLLHEIDIYENEHKETPSFDRIWLNLISNPPKEYNVMYDKKTKTLGMEGEGRTDKDNFEKRYNNIFKPLKNK